MNMSVKSSSPPRHQFSGTGDSNSPTETPSGNGPDSTSSKTEQMTAALKSYLQNNALNDIQKKLNKAEQARKKNVATQKEKKAEEDE